MPSHFYPRLSYITNITNAQNAVVTFEDEHDFTDGEIISLRVSKPYGMFQVNQKAARVLAHTSDSVTLELDTLGLNAFVYPAVGTVVEIAVAVPSSSGVVPYLYTPSMNLEDSFDHRPST